MILILAVIAAGVLLGLALGGSLRTLAELRFRWGWLAVVGLGLQLVPLSASPRNHGLSVALLIVSYATLAPFVVANIRLPGMALIGVGFALNALVILANGGMPVSDNALQVAYGPRYPELRRELIEGGGAKHHLASSDDVLRPLTDVIGVGFPFRQVLSIGDLIWMAGTIWLLAAATAGKGKHRRPRARASQRPPPGRAA